MDNKSNSYIQYYDANKEKVKEFINTKSKYIFILESPHTEEVKNGYIACGTSGKSMAKVLGLSKDKSLGELLNNKKCLNISVLNVSRVPLQKVDGINIEEEFINNINELRKKYIKDSEASLYKVKELKKFEKYILNDFRKRIIEVNKFSKKPIIIVCGNFAKVYFDEILKNNNLEYEDILYVMHPSRNQWSNYVKWKEHMDQMLNLDFCDMDIKDDVR